MRRFWCDRKDWRDDQLEITGDLFHHLHDVCRFSVGAQFELLAPGEAWLVEVTESGRKSLIVKRLERRALPELPRPHLHLALSLPRHQKTDWIVEKCVEIGVHSIHPFVSEFSFVRQVDGLKGSRLERWHKIIRQATQQSGRGDLMEFHAPETLAGLLTKFNQSPQVTGLFLYEGECRFTLKSWLRQLATRDCSAIWFFIGSEGGFSAAEVGAFKSVGLEPLSLGDRVLRVETACVAVASILKYEAGG